MNPRFEVQKHTDDREFGFRVVDLLTLETYGFGLLFEHAVELAAQLDQWPDRRSLL